MLNSRFLGFEWATSSQGLWLRTQAWRKRKMFWVWNSNTLLSSIHVPPLPPPPPLLFFWFLPVDNFHVHPSEEYAGGEEKRERKLRHSILDAAMLKRNSKPLTPSLTCICGMPFCLQHPLCRGKGIRQNFHRNSRMWSTYLSQHQGA